MIRDFLIILQTIRRIVLRLTDLWSALRPVLSEIEGVIAAKLINELSASATESIDNLNNG